MTLPDPPAPTGAAAAGHDDGLGAAVRLSVPVAMAYVPLGMAFGILVVKSGLAWYWAPLSALVIFAGSIEFVAVSLIVGMAPISQVALTALAVNFRHVFYGLSFPLRRLRHPLQRAYGVWALTDETYAITAVGRGARLTGPQITALQLASHLWWVGAALAGALVGRVLPDAVTGFGFALTAMFVVLFVDAVREHRVPGQLAAAAVAVVAAGLVGRWRPDAFLVVGLGVYVGIATLRFLAASPEQRRTLR